MLLGEIEEDSRRLTLDFMRYHEGATKGRYLLGLLMREQVSGRSDERAFYYSLAKNIHTHLSTCLLQFRHLGLQLHDRRLILKCRSCMVG